MEYNKKGIIKSKIIKESDIIEIKNFFEKLVDENGGEKSIEINFRDKSSISIENGDAFETKILSRKDIESIYFSYRKDIRDKKVMVRLEETSSFPELSNTYEIISSDEKWYNATRSELEDVISTIQNQLWIRNMLNFPLVLLTFIFYWAIICGIMILIFGFEYVAKLTEAESFVIITPFYISGTAVFYWLNIAIQKLFPLVEFDFDSPRNLKRERIKKTIGWILVVIIIPVIITLIMK